MGWWGPLTHRQYCAWQEWLNEEMNHPSRADFYTMQLTEVVCHILSNDWSKFNTNRHKIKIGHEEDLPVRNQSPPAAPRQSIKSVAPSLPSSPEERRAKARDYAMAHIQCLGGPSAVKGSEVLFGEPVPK